MARLILIYQIDHCGPQTVSTQDESYATSDADKTITWFHTTVLENSDFQVVKQTKHAPYSDGILSFHAHGQKLFLVWHQFQDRLVPTNDRLEIAACVYVPIRIDVIDSDFNGDSARILFQQRLGYSQIGQLMESSEVLQRYNSFEPGDYEYVARLSKDAEGGWTVRSTRLNL